jgi:hypothetical protein
MLKGLRFSVAEKDATYQAIRDKAILLLKGRNAFRKSAVIEALRLKAFENAIRWDHIRTMIENHFGGVSLIPVAESYFASKIMIDGVQEDNNEALRRRLPERFVASGHGKKTAGYATVIPQNDHLVLVVARRKDAQAKGSKRVAEKFVQDAVGLGCKVLLLSDDTHKLSA